MVKFDMPSRDVQTGGARKRKPKTKCKKNRASNRCVLSTRKTDSRLCRRTAKGRCAVAHPTVAPAYVPKGGLSAKEQASARKAHNSRMRRAVYNGKYKKTRGGLTKADLTISHVSGKVVSKKKASLGRYLWAKNVEEGEGTYGKMHRPFGKERADILTYEQFICEVKESFKNGEWQGHADRFIRIHNKTPDEHPLFTMLGKLNAKQMERFLHDTYTREYERDGNNGVDVMNMIDYDDYLQTPIDEEVPFTPGNLRTRIQATLDKIQEPGYGAIPDDEEYPEEDFPTDDITLVGLTLDSICLRYYKSGNFDSEWKHYVKASRSRRRSRSRSRCR